MLTEDHAIAITERWLNTDLGVRDSIVTYCEENELTFTPKGLYRVAYAPHNSGGEGGFLYLYGSSPEVVALQILVMDGIMPIGEPELVEIWSQS